MEIAVLSNSRFTLFCQCLKVLWMRGHKPELAMVEIARKLVSNKVIL